MDVIYFSINIFRILLFLSQIFEFITISNTLALFPKKGFFYKNSMKKIFTILFFEYLYFIICSYFMLLLYNDCSILWLFLQFCAGYFLILFFQMTGKNISCITNSRKQKKYPYDLYIFLWKYWHLTFVLPYVGISEAINYLPCYTFFREEKLTCLEMCQKN